MTPATSATSPAIDQTITQMVRSEIPTDSAAWWSSATARSARPVRVTCEKSVSPATSAAATSAATTSSLSMYIPQ